MARKKELPSSADELIAAAAEEGIRLDLVAEELGTIPSRIYARRYYWACEPVACTECPICGQEFETWALTLHLAACAERAFGALVCPTCLRRHETPKDLRRCYDRHRLAALKRTLE